VWILCEENFHVREIKLSFRIQKDEGFKKVTIQQSVSWIKVKPF